MNKELLKQKIEELDTNKVIFNLEVIEELEYIKIKTDFFEIYYNKYGVKYHLIDSCIYSERFEIYGYKYNNIKIMKKVLNFLKNNIDRINQIIKDNI